MSGRRLSLAKRDNPDRPRRPSEIELTALLVVPSGTLRAGRGPPACSGW